MFNSIAMFQKQFWTESKCESITLFKIDQKWWRLSHFWLSTTSGHVSQNDREVEMDGVIIWNTRLVSSLTSKDSSTANKFAINKLSCVVVRFWWSMTLLSLVCNYGLQGIRCQWAIDHVIRPPEYYSYFAEISCKKKLTLNLN